MGAIVRDCLRQTNVNYLQLPERFLLGRATFMVVSLFKETNTGAFFAAAACDDPSLLMG
jgi:hypothetical protein